MLTPPSTSPPLSFPTPLPRSLSASAAACSRGCPPLSSSSLSLSHSLSLTLLADRGAPSTRPFPPRTPARATASARPRGPLPRGPGPGHGGPGRPGREPPRPGPPRPPRLRPRRRRRGGPSHPLPAPGGSHSARRRRRRRRGGGGTLLGRCPAECAPRPQPRVVPFTAGHWRETPKHHSKVPREYLTFFPTFFPFLFSTAHHQGLVLEGCTLVRGDLGRAVGPAARARRLTHLDVSGCRRLEGDLGEVRFGVRIKGLGVRATSAS